MECEHGNPVETYCKQCGPTRYEIAQVICSITDGTWTDFNEKSTLEEVFERDLDSISRMNLCATIEQEFDIKIPSGDEMKWETVDDVYKAVESAEVL